MFSTSQEIGFYKELISLIPQLRRDKKEEPMVEEIEEPCNCQHFDILITNEVIFVKIRSLTMILRLFIIKYTHRIPAFFLVLPKERIWKVNF